MVEKITMGITINIRGRPWDVGEAAYHEGCSGSHIKNLYLLVTLLLSRACANMKGLVSF